MRALKREKKRLKEEMEFLKKVCVLRERPRVKYALIQDYSGQYSISLMCRVLSVQRSGFYVWRNKPKSHQEERREKMESLVKDTYEEFEAAYGAPRITQELNALGHKCSLNYVAKIMSNQGILARNGKAFNYDGHALMMNNIADNLLWRDFSASRPNQKWVTDITYIWVERQWLYLATVMDLYSRSNRWLEFGCQYDRGIDH